jgi:hypothetical protein
MVIPSPSTATTTSGLFLRVSPLQTTAACVRASDALIGRGSETSVCGRSRIRLLDDILRRSTGGIALRTAVSNIIDPDLSVKAIEILSKLLALSVVGEQFPPAPTRFAQNGAKKTPKPGSQTRQERRV